MRAERKNNKGSGLHFRKRFYLIILLILVLGGAGLFFTLPGKDAKPKEPKPGKPVQLNLLCAGDLVIHMDVINAAKKSDGTYNFEWPFDSVKPYIGDADLAMCNLETTFTRGN